MSTSKSLFKKWNKLARFTRKPDSADKGHFVIYTTDLRRLMIPLSCLDSDIFRELLKQSKEEFGLPCDGPIMLPCDAFFVEYVISLISQRPDGDLEKAIIMSLVASHCSSPAGLELQQQIVC